MPVDLLQSVAANLWAVFLIILFFGGSIFVHELGHFLAARRRGVHVARFSIGFGPKIISWQGKDGVEFCLSWLPLGGYVALPQLADMHGIEGESGVDVEKLPPVSYSTKIIVFVAGAAFNILFAFLLASIIWVAGQPVTEEEQTTRVGIARPTIETTDGRTVPGPAYDAGLRAGDIILAVDGRTVDSFSDISQLVALGSGRTADGRREVIITCEREGRKLTAVVHPRLVGPEELRDIGLEPAVKVMIALVQAGTPAEEAGLRPRDIITHIDGRPVNYSGFIADYLRNGEGRKVDLTVLRDGRELMASVAPRKMTDPDSKSESYRLGLQLRSAFTVKVVHVPPWTQLVQHVVVTWRTLVSLANPKSDIGFSKMSGPVGIAERVHAFAKFDIRLVVWFIIFLNVNLAIVNLLPIPVLDGGHILFATIARLRGRALPANFTTVTQSVFIVLLFSLFLYTFFNDVRRITRDTRADSPPAANPPAAPAGPEQPATPKP